STAFLHPHHLAVAPTRHERSVKQIGDAENQDGTENHRYHDLDERQAALLMHVHRMVSTLTDSFSPLAVQARVTTTDTAPVAASGAVATMLVLAASTPGRLSRRLWHQKARS